MEDGVLGMEITSNDISESDLVKALEKINESHTMLSTLLEHTRHLPVIAGTSAEIKACLLSAAIGKDHVPLPVVEKIIKIFGIVIATLLMVLVFILTGIKLGWFPVLH
jgi:hypothetical protein